MLQVNRVQPRGAEQGQLPGPPLSYYTLSGLSAVPPKNSRPSSPVMVWGLQPLGDNYEMGAEPSCDWCPCKRSMGLESWLSR